MLGPPRASAPEGCGEPWSVSKVCQNQCVISLHPAVWLDHLNKIVTPRARLLVLPGLLQPRSNQQPSSKGLFAMSITNYPVGLELVVAFEPFSATLSLLSDHQLKFEIKEGPFRHSEVVDTHVVSLGNSVFAVSWKEATGATVTHVQDFDRGVIYSHATLTDGQFLRLTGSITVISQPGKTSDDRPTHNKALVLDAMTSLFQRRDVDAVDRLYAQTYIQHNPNIPQGRAALKALVAQLGDQVFYEPGLILAEGDFVAIHGRIRGWSETPQVVVDLFRVEDGKLAEHWDVLQDEVPMEIALTGISMFDPEESKRAPS